MKASVNGKGILIDVSSIWRLLNLYRLILCRSFCVDFLFVFYTQINLQKDLFDL